MLGADARALADKRASPNAIGMGQYRGPFRRALVARIHVVALRQRDGRRPDEHWIQSHHRTRRVAQRTVDAHAELLVAVHLLRSLQEFALRKRRFILWH